MFRRFFVVLILLLRASLGFLSSPSGNRIARSVLRLNGGDGVSDLSNALARLDQQWKIQQTAKRRSRWSKITLDDNGVEEVDVGGAASKEEFVYLLEPPGNTLPSCVLVFVGGAGLGQFPQVAYNEFLIRLSDRLNAAVIAAPYTVGLDHFGLAKSVGDLSRRALLHCEQDPQRLYPESIPTYLIGHSLGCKLASIYLAATGQHFEGLGFLSYNNFGFGQTIGMAKVFAEQIRANSSGKGSPMNKEVMDQVFSFAEMAIGTIGLDFTPNPKEMDRLLSLKFSDENQKKTRLFVFDDDTLDSSPGFVESCSGRGPEASALPGSHLTPVFFKLGLEELPEEARDLAREASGGFESASFGNEENLDALVDEVTKWILGMEPSRRPTWQRQTPLIPGSSTSDSR